MSKVINMFSESVNHSLSPVCYTRCLRDTVVPRSLLIYVFSLRFIRPSTIYVVLRRSSLLWRSVLCSVFNCFHNTFFTVVNSCGLDLEILDTPLHPTPDSILKPLLLVTHRHYQTRISAVFSGPLHFLFDLCSSFTVVKSPVNQFVYMGMKQLLRGDRYPFFQSSKKF